MSGAWPPPRRRSVAWAIRAAGTARSLRALATAIRAGEYGDPPWLNEQVARFYEAQAADTMRKLRSFEATGGFERRRG